jgi:hypothetical protein
MREKVRYSWVARVLFQKELEEAGEGMVITLADDAISHCLAWLQTL